MTVWQSVLSHKDKNTTFKFNSGYISSYHVIDAKYNQQCAFVNFCTNIGKDLIRVQYNLILLLVTPPGINDNFQNNAWELAKAVPLLLTDLTIVHMSIGSRSKNPIFFLYDFGYNLLYCNELKWTLVSAKKCYSPP